MRSKRKLQKNIRHWIMNILVLNGSPHVNGNTMAMVNAFVDGAREKNHDI